MWVMERKKVTEKFARYNKNVRNINKKISGQFLPIRH